MRKSGSKSFTLVELLVVISIIGLLSSIIIVSVNGVRKKARDAKRLADMQQIVKALMLYYDDKNGRFPGSTSSYGESEPLGCGGWDSSAADNDSDGRFFIEPLETDGIMPKVPLDPINTAVACNGYTYRYYRYGAGTSGCDAIRGAFFVLGVNDMETSGRPYPASPGWSCPSRNWQGEFDWVIGGFEN